MSTTDAPAKIKITATRSVLAWSGNPAAADVFGGPVYVPETDPGDPARGHALVLDPDVFDEMGEPAVVTVTVRPGDLLNLQLPDGCHVDFVHATMGDLIAELEARLEAVEPDESTPADDAERLAAAWINLGNFRGNIVEAKLLDRGAWFPADVAMTPDRNSPREPLAVGDPGPGVPADRPYPTDLPAGHNDPA